MVPERRSAPVLESLRQPRLLAGAAVLTAAACLYLATLDDGLRMEELKGGDLITHQYAQIQGRPSNAPGYPLYTMGGWLWFRVAIVIFRGLLSPLQVLSSYSTVWAVAALAVFYALALRLGRGRWLLAVAATMLYAVTYFFWYYAVSTEQYSSAVFQTLLLLWLALRWQERRQDRYLRWIAFVAGTCLANLVTAAFIVPGLFWFVASQDRSILRRRRLLFELAGLALLPLLSYAYVYVRGAQHPEWRGQGQWPSTMAWFVSFLSTGQGRQEMTTRLLPLDLSYLHLVPDELTWPVLLAGLIGLAVLERHQAILHYTTIAIYLLFSYIDRFGNWYQVVMPVYPLVVLGCVALARWLDDRFSGSGIPATVATVLLLAVGGERLHTNCPRADLSRAPDDDALCYGESILLDLGDTAASGTIAVTYEEELSLQYLAAVYGYGSSLTIVSPDEVDDSVRYISRAALPLVGALPASWQQPWALGASLLTNADNGIPASPESWPAGPLTASVTKWEVRPRPAACGGDVAVVQVLWQVTNPPVDEFAVSARLLQSGKPVPGPTGPLQDDHPPLWGASSPAEWLAGQRWLDSYSFALPNDASADALRLIGYTPESSGTEVLWSVDLPLPRPSVAEPVVEPR